MSKKYYKVFTLRTEEFDSPYHLQGHLIRMARVNKRLTQEGLAKLLNESLSKVRTIEVNGADGVILVKLIKLLKLDESYFMFEDGDED
ncbi:helix-turn-helix domain-containing protein (plasmid) [Nostoc sp. C052]|uniref:helix-turn-helix domain-containing protein n=1 Tax=Nostoc sp. C052 TaxID=2576902 RepID=UPI0015C3F5A4|nr:helix-turn-helix domain-containing protein [Nostoc sp. C052]QLE46547.1 helix-turn-helix domain-containing protein [Nostoc sp. C052]